MIITGGKYRSRKLISPAEKIVKPTLSKVRESVFNILYSRIDFKDKTFLDLFAGSGIMGFEAISRGFSTLIAIDNNANNITLLKKNASSLGIDGKFIKYDALKYLKAPKDKVDVIFIDPPYDTDLANFALDEIINNGILNKDGIIIIETRKNKQIDFDGYTVIKECNYGLCNLYFLTIS
ncbi:16S rRNA (guanine(966)-N(2))-methyltransferase RsmD [bacterium]|nr:16S rRNA (guanine(966)-N(2))-methyltransferase RsmD [bacterium]